ncbi:MAG: DUF418 domain-containing protein [Ilumatobacteraceae bacterium]
MVRALAMAGVVMMNYHGYLIQRGARRDGGGVYDVFDPWVGPLSTRFAATFVLTAGVGVSLMTRSSRCDRGRTIEMRWRLVRRGLLLYSGGLLFDFIWPGTILPYYGLMFVLAASIFTLRIRFVVAIGLSAAVIGALVSWWIFRRDQGGDPLDWLTEPGRRSPRGLVFDVFVNGTHPILPWLAFFCAGIVLGRLLSSPWWRPAAIGSGFTLFSIATLLTTVGSGATARHLLSDDPFDRGLVYVASALGTALIAFGAISWLADRFEHTAGVDWLRRAGQLSLTIYLGHALLFNLFVDWLDLIEPRGVGTALTAAGTYWLIATALAVTYQRRYGRGPAERIYRNLTN